MLNKKHGFIIQNLLSLTLMVFLLLPIQNCKKEKVEVPSPPQTKVVEVIDNLHGVEIKDPYQWLEDKESPETREWIKIQNEYTDSILGSLPDRGKIRDLLAKLIMVDTISIPIEREGCYFLTKRTAEQELSIIYLREGLEGEDQVLIDPHPMSEDNTINVNILDISKDARLLAYGVRKGGEDEVEVKFFDVEEKKDLPDSLPWARYSSISISLDRSGLYYTRHQTEGPRLYYHMLGTDVTADNEIFGEGYGPDKILNAYLSENGRWLVVFVRHGAGARKGEIFLKDFLTDKPFFPVVTDITATFSGSIGGSTLFLQTDWEAPNNRIFAVDLENSGQNNWQEVIPESDVAIQGFSLAGGNLFVRYMKDAKTSVVQFKSDGTRIREISFPAIGSVRGISGNWESNEAFFVFSSFHIPTTIFRYDIANGTQEAWAKIDVPIDSGKFEVKQVRYESKDGTEIPMFIVHAKDIRLDGSNPALLTGYGGFGSSRTPSFSTETAAWLEEGGVYAVANLRGGSEFGEEWHRAGMLENKQNVFDDFIAAADYLIREGYTRPEKLAIKGGSNGGLLVGATMTQRPDLFAAVVCTYPLLDMVRYHKFLVAKYWVPEYGSSDDPEQFKYIHAYSPYHNVEKGIEYPAVLFITGDADTRVDPLHARKMAALVQASTGSDKHVMLRYYLKAGHSASRGLPVSQQIENLTDIMSFLMWQLKGNL